MRTFVPAGGRLTWQGSEDLGFPALLAQPEYSCRFRPADGSEPRRISVRLGHPERMDEWSVLLICVEEKSWVKIERRVHAHTWWQALDRAAAAVPLLLQEQVDRAGGGTLEDVDAMPACDVPRPDCETERPATGTAGAPPK